MADGTRPASTVLMVRDGTDGIEVYLQRRPAAMRFAGGFWVFPGGRVDEADRDPAIDTRWMGPPPETWAQAMDVPVDLARGHLVAACREALEESGILLTSDSPRADAVAEARRALLDDDRAMVDVIGDLGVRLDAGLMRYWDWWVTPVSEPRRYDTRFFVARLPDAAVVTPHTREVVEEMWATAADVDTLHVIAPTYYTMRDALAHPSVDALLADATRRTVAAVQPTIEDGDIVLPWDERFPLPEGFGDALHGWAAARPRRARVACRTVAVGPPRPVSPCKGALRWRAPSGRRARRAPPSSSCSSTLCSSSPSPRSPGSCGRT